MIDPKDLPDIFKPDPDFLKRREPEKPITLAEAKELMELLIKKHFPEEDNNG